MAEAIADVAAVFHWPLSELEDMDPADLSSWQKRAVDRWKAMNGG